MRLAASFIAVPDGSTAQSPVTVAGRCDRFRPEPKPELDHVAVQSLADSGANVAERPLSEHDVDEPRQDPLGVESPRRKGYVRGVDPADALDRIADLLVRGREPRYKSRLSAVPRTR